MNLKPKHILFKTLSKRNVVILQNPSIKVERYKSGNKRDRVKSKTKIRYCEDFDTIDIVEQNRIDPRASASSIFMRKGTYVVTEDEIAYGISYKWESGGNLYAGIQTDIYKNNEDYISDVFPFIGLRISENLKINCFYGYNLLYNNGSTSGDLYGGSLSYELSGKYEIGVNYKEIDNSSYEIEAISIFFNFKI